MVTADEKAEAKAKADAEKAEAKAKKEVSLVRFTLKSGVVRDFTEANHGENFVELATEFGETNKISIANREDIAA